MHDPAVQQLLPAPSVAPPDDDNLVLSVKVCNISHVGVELAGSTDRILVSFHWRPLLANITISPSVSCKSHRANKNLQTFVSLCSFICFG